MCAFNSDLDRPCRGAGAAGAATGNLWGNIENGSKGGNERNAAPPLAPPKSEKRTARTPCMHPRHYSPGAGKRARFYSDGVLAT
eukprot:gene11137-biopygen15389